MQKLFIHIGTHKTGSTAVQRALRMAKDDLIKEGIVFIPELFFSERSIGLISNWDMNVINECRQFLLKETESYRHLKNYRFVISYEGFSGYALNGFSNTKLVAKYLREITRDFDVFIVVYLRRQDHFLESLYTQYIHIGNSLTFNDFVNQFDSTSFDWFLFLNNYVEYFNKEKIIVRRYDREFLSCTDGIFEDFTRIIRSSSLRHVKLNNFPNAGYSRDALEIARLCNPCLDEKGKKRLRKILQSTNAKQPFDNYAFFTATERKKFLAKYLHSNAAVAREYLNDPSEKLFDSLNIKNHSEDYQGLSIDNAIIVFMRALVGMENWVKKDS